MLFNDHFKEQFNEKLKTCKECKLCDLQGPITGYGSANPDVMIIADMPVQSDLKASIPFTGKARTLMTEFIKKTELQKGEYYLTYMVKHVPTKEKKPDNSDLLKCTDILLKEIELMDPRIIVSMGFFVTKYLIESYIKNNTIFSIKEMRGNAKILPKKTRGTRLLRPKRYLIPTWNPNTDNLLKIENIKEDAEMVNVLRKMGITLFD